MLYPFLLTAQDDDRWSLERCVLYAQQNSLQVRQAQVNIQQSKLNEKQARWSRSPSASANFSHSLNLGRSIDFTTYEFVNEAIQASSAGLSINVPIYNGNRINNSIKQSRLDVEASEKDVEDVKNNLALSVAQAYLQVLFAEEALSVSTEQMRISQEQLDQTNRLIKAGSLPENNRFDLEAQLARDEQAVVNAENSVTLGYLNLKTLLNLDPNEPMQIVRPDLEMPNAEDMATLQSLYEDAVNNQPNIAASRIRERSAELGVLMSKGALLPSVSAFANLNTNFSSVGERFTGDSISVTQSFSGEFNGVPITFDIPSSVPERENNPFFSQMGDNLRQSFGVSVQVPIFNAMQNRIAIERSELAVELARLNTKQVKQQLKADIQRALTDADAARKRYEAAEKSLKAIRAAAQNTQRRYELGIVNAFELSSVRNNLMAAESELLQAKYDYIFRLKILDFYRGLPIQL